MIRTWLPPELIDMVMDHLHSDRRTLAACSVVCKAWIYPARSRLFADINISLNQTGLKKLLESGSAVIPFIRHLHVECCKPSIWNENILRPVGFKSIRSLSLEYFPWQDVFPEARSSLQTHFAAIVCLRLIEIDAYSFSEVAEAICSFRRLETLVMERVNWDDIELPSSSLCLSDKLRVLEVWNCEPEGGPILEWLLSLERTPALHTVYLHECDLDEINSFLQALGISLEVLWCGTRSYNVDQSINLSYNTCLQVLHIELDNYDRVNGTRQRVTQWVTRVLSQIVSEHMNRVVFEVVVNVDLDDSQGFLEWTEVDSILALSQFTRLKNVDINVFEIFNEDLSERLDFPDWFISRLPQCHARGILSIHLAKWKSTYL